MAQGNQQAAATVIGLARAGDTAGAIAAGEGFLASGPADPGLTLFVGVLCCRQGELARGIAHLRRAVELAPAEPMAKIELARALLADGANAEAEAVAGPLASLASPAGREMQRIRAHALLREAGPEESRDLFEQLTGADGGDFESWDGLGAARLALGDPHGAIEALRRATTLRPTAIAYWVNLARAYVAVHDYGAGAEAARTAVGRAADDASAQLVLGRALAGLGEVEAALASLAAARAAAPGNAELLTEIADAEFTCKAFDRAEAGYRTALALRPDLKLAWLGLAKVAERTNRTADLFELLEAAEAAGVSRDATALLRARALRSEGRLEEALATAQGAEGADKATRAQLIGEIADRLGDTDTAFAAFSEATAALADSWQGSAERAADYREIFARLTDLVTPEWAAGWTPAPPPGPRRSPLFIFGFPRSGTTLIDTMLSGHPDAVVYEEEPMIDNIAKRFGAFEQLPDLSAAEIETLRAAYFAEADRIAPAADRLIVDKHPLALGSTPLMFRLFPQARFVFVERHPCDVVLSCFITSAQMDANIANFFDFTGTALLYDRVLTYWERCKAALPMQVHTIRYERLIADPEAELRALADFAGLEWTPQLLAHQSNASARAFIGSPSYAQVAEPLYTRAKGRWLRYRGHMEKVLPILAPWAERMGYSLDG
ncbi:MAG: sulfotransferase [Pseudomonadota bacterium]